MAPDRGVTGRHPELFPVGLGEPASRSRHRLDRHRARRPQVPRRGDHPGTRRRVAVLPHRPPSGEDRPAARGRRAEAVPARRARRSRRGDVSLPVAGSGRRGVHHGRLQGVGRDAEPAREPGLRRSRGDPVRHAHRQQRRRGVGTGQLGRASADASGRDATRTAGARRSWQELGARHRRRRRNGSADPVPGALPLAGGDPVPAARLPRSRVLEPRQLACRHRRRSAPRTDHLCVHRRQLPGLAAAWRGPRRRGAGVRVRAVAHTRDHRPRAAPADAAPPALDGHERQPLVQWRLARPLPRHPGRPPRGASRGSQRRQPAAVTVGAPVHQQRGLARPTDGQRRRQHDRLLLPGEPPALPRASHPLGLAAAGDAVVHRRTRRGRAGRHAGRGDGPLGRRRPRPRRHRRHPPPAGSRTASRRR